MKMKTTKLNITNGEGSLSRSEMKNVIGGKVSDDLTGNITCSNKCDVDPKDGGPVIKSGCYADATNTSCLCLDRNNNSQC